MKQQPTLSNSIFIGDKVVDVCSAIGVYCKAMSTSTVPMIEERYPFSKQMECTLCIMGEKRKLLYYTAKKLNINHIVLEENASKPNPAAMADELTALGYTVDIINFNGPLQEAIRQAGAIFGREKIAEQRASQYEKEMAKALPLMPQALNKRVLVLMGLSHKYLDNTYLLVETSGGDADKLILKPTGCFSVGDELAKGDKDGLGVTVIDNLSCLGAANPDIIALLGDPYIPQLAIKRQLAATPKLAEIPAIANQSIFHLPDCSPGAPVNIPNVMRRWAEALAL